MQQEISDKNNYREFTERLDEGISSRAEQWWTVIEYANEKNEVV